MPYKDFTKIEKGKKKFCMTSIKTNKTYCYDSKTKRDEGKRLHEAFAHGFKMTKK